MYVEDVRLMFDGFVDEPDFDFMTIDERRSALSAAYAAFRMTIAELDEYAYINAEDFTVSGTNLSLSTTVPPLLGGASVAGKRMLRLRKVSIVENGESLYFLVASRDLTDFDGGSLHSRFSLVPSYMLVNDTLFFSANMDTKIRVWYDVDSKVDWTKDVKNDKEYIDDFSDYHSLIALYAARDYYMVRDAAISKTLISRVNVEESRIKNHLKRGRSIDSFESVMEVF